MTQCTPHPRVNAKNKKHEIDTNTGNNHTDLAEPTQTSAYLPASLRALVIAAIMADPTPDPSSAWYVRMLRPFSPKMSSSAW